MEDVSSNDKADLLVGNFALNLHQLPLMSGKRVNGTSLAVTSTILQL